MEISVETMCVLIGITYVLILLTMILTLKLLIIKLKKESIEVVE